MASQSAGASDPDPALVARIERLVGRGQLTFKPVQGGYTAAKRYICRSEDAVSAFVKIAGNERTAGWLRREHLVYKAFEAPFMAHFVAFDDDESQPLLIVEDLSAHHWPPPWTERSVALALQAVHDMHAMKADVPSYAELHGPRPSQWTNIRNAPDGLLGLAPAAEDWLGAALPALIEHEEKCTPAGEALCHFDIRSDNICLSDEQAFLIDWNNACLGNPDLDLGFWLPSLCHEGGPLPEEILPHRRDIACWVAGMFAALAISSAERLGTDAAIHILQRQQMNEAIEWAARSLGLSRPDLA